MSTISVILRGGPSELLDRALFSLVGQRRLPDEVLACDVPAEGRASLEALASLAADQADLKVPVAKKRRALAGLFWLMKSEREVLTLREVSRAG